MNTAAEQWPRAHLISVDEYYRMAEVGLLSQARVELIEGVIIDMAPIGSRHAGIINALNSLLVQAVSSRALICVQQPIRLSTTSEPQPDVSLLRPRADFYRGGHPTAADVLLLIEVSDATLRFDLDKKLALYAKHGIPEYWVIDAQGKQLHCMRQPAGESYRSVVTLGIEKNAFVAALPDVKVGLTDLLG